MVRRKARGAQRMGRARRGDRGGARVRRERHAVPSERLETQPAGGLGGCTSNLRGMAAGPAKEFFHRPRRLALELGGSLAGMEHDRAQRVGPDFLFSLVGFLVLPRMSSLGLSTPGCALRRRAAPVVSRWSAGE